MKNLMNAVIVNGVAYQINAKGTLLTRAMKENLLHSGRGGCPIRRQIVLCNREEKNLYESTQRFCD